MNGASLLSWFGCGICVQASHWSWSVEKKCKWTEKCYISVLPSKWRTRQSTSENEYLRSSPPSIHKRTNYFPTWLPTKDSITYLARRTKKINSVPWLSFNTVFKRLCIIKKWENYCILNFIYIIISHLYIILLSK